MFTLSFDISYSPEPDRTGPDRAGLDRIGQERILVPSSHPADLRDRQPKLNYRISLNTEVLISP